MLRSGLAVHISALPSTFTLKPPARRMTTLILGLRTRARYRSDKCGRDWPLRRVCSPEKPRFVAELRDVPAEGGKRFISFWH
jgi:hypothetical protein